MMLQLIRLCLGLFSHVPVVFCIKSHWLIKAIVSLSLSLIKSQLLSTSLLLPPSPPCHQSEGTGSIVIGLQSWQPYDWAVGYCNWIRLEISSVPVRLLKSQSVVPWLAPVIHTFFPPSWLWMEAAVSWVKKSVCVRLCIWHVGRVTKKWNQSESREE